MAEGKRNICDKCSDCPENDNTLQECWKSCTYPIEFLQSIEHTREIIKEMLETIPE